MKKLTIKTAAIALFAAMLCYGCKSAPVTMKDALKDKFLIGVAMNAPQISGRDSVGVAIIKREFSSIVAENCMKSSLIHPEENRYDFTLPDKFVEFGVNNNMFIIGHTLVWHSQLAPWFCKDDKGNDVSRDVLIERLRSHITTVVGRYKGKVKGWDVVNEAILDDGSMRDTPFLRIIGKDFIKLAFEFAHAADPDAELYYNDFSMSEPGKRAAVVAMVNDLKAQGVRVDGIGMQGHVGLDYPQLNEFEKSIVDFASTGAKVMITEFDITALPSPRMGANIADTAGYSQKMNPYKDGLPKEISMEWDKRAQAFVELFLKHSDKISRLTTWGLSDRDSWKNNWPIPGRTDYPLFYDRNHNPKAIVEWIQSIKK